MCGVCDTPDAGALAWRRGPLCARVHGRVLVPPNLYIHTYIYIYIRTHERERSTQQPQRTTLGHDAQHAQNKNDTRCLAAERASREQSDYCVSPTESECNTQQ